MRAQLILTMISLGLTFGPSQASAQARRPYLQLVTDGGGTVAWRSIAAEPSRVCWGTSTTSLTNTAGTGAAERDHAVRIEGLAAGQTVFYAAATTSCPPSAPGRIEDYFTTAPPRGGDAPFRAWIVGDSGSGNARQRAVRDAMLSYTASRPIDMFIHVGDMAYNDGTTAEFDSRFFAPYEGVMAHVPVWAAIGNHESHSANTATQTGPFYEAYIQPTGGEAGGLPSGTEAYYAFDWGNVHFVVLDTEESDRTPGGAMLRWLDMDLSANDQEWTIAFFHHPPYTHGSHDSDAESQLRQVRQNIVPILDAHGVDLVLTGHSHLYERSFLVRGAYDTPTTAPGHIVDVGDGRLDGDGPYESGPMGSVHVVAGHGGTGVSGAGDHPLMFFSEVQNGSCIMDVRGSLLTLENLRYDGVVTDHVALVHRDGPFLLAPGGGEEFLAGASIDVRWGWSGASPPANVQLELSVDDGRTFVTLAASTPNDGIERLMLPATFTDVARVRLSPAGASAPNDVSGVFSIVSRGTIIAIPLGGIWSYSDDGVDPGPGFLTGAGGPYPEGAAELGYGDGDEATTLSNTPTDPSILFRRNVPLNARVTRAIVRARYDDGIAVFVNGTPVLERDMDNGLGYSALASGGGDDNEEVFSDVAVEGFVRGDNWIVAIVKQQGLGSSDLSFDLELTLEVEVDGAPPFDGGMRADVPNLDAGRPPPIDVPGLDGSVGGDTSTESGGCGCRAGQRRSGGAILAAALGLLLLARRKRLPSARARFIPPT